MTKKDFDVINHEIFNDAFKQEADGKYVLTDTGDAYFTFCYAYSKLNDWACRLGLESHFEQRLHELCYDVYYSIYDNFWFFFDVIDRWNLESEFPVMLNAKCVPFVYDIFDTLQASVDNNGGAWFDRGNEEIIEELCERVQEFTEEMFNSDLTVKQEGTLAFLEAIGNAYWIHETDIIYHEFSDDYMDEINNLYNILIDYHLGVNDAVRAEANHILKCLAESVRNEK